MKSPNMTEQGFSLLEVMVTLLIMSILSVLSWRALDYIQRTQTQLDQAQSQHLSIHAVLQQFEDDIQRHYKTLLLDQHQANAQALLNPEHPHRYLHWEAQANGSALSILQAAPVGQAGTRWVRWSFNQQQLFRDFGSSGTHLPLTFPQTKQVVLDDVQAVHFRAWIPARGWQDLPLRDTKHAPTGIELSVERVERERVVTYRKVVLLP
ncbi:PulJ/GspJ family protein [Alcaligenes endophyticus]|uniref:Prepilin-type N-terminal cleavage/methylation domain-containing protein n=1 Tax=Alcaligenes endophyticus TaxID=1929088 RepID=A0ABT8EGJ9_9BURK|nr:prepilin-type N-terminal cleavage/methylation domain-containing protein [Alcaligenes endophyticus]MCX5589920.1 prepilin-type N-terminal cleavage/methylation domain-containing protein [Alcaligenes endophyticus]MDN4120417.1 prepilin-type N-terminal cleavage/methylation domain-containing protein [Alcaligenes endophyticus]